MFSSVAGGFIGCSVITAGKEEGSDGNTSSCTVFTFDVLDGEGFVECR